MRVQKAPQNCKGATQKIIQRKTDDVIPFEKKIFWNQLPQELP